MPSNKNIFCLKLLCLMLELTLTSENNMETIEKVQHLPKSVQTGIMAVTNLVGENSQSSNLSQILSNWLVQNGLLLLFVVCLCAWSKVVHIVGDYCLNI